jgi:hypothetical protein
MLCFAFRGFFRSFRQLRNAGNWTKEYTFSSEYGYEGYTAKSLQGLIAQFVADANGASQPSQDYMLHLIGGSQKRAQEPQRTWPATACQIGHVDPAEYRQCVC